MTRKKIWLAATALLFIPGIHFWASSTAPVLKRPETPVELMRPESAAQWHFLDVARNHIPPGSSYTITAATREEEMALFMMSLGLITHATGEPTSYYSVAHAHIGARAEYILSYACSGADQTAELVTYLPGGCILRRPR